MIVYCSMKHFDDRIQLCEWCSVSEDKKHDFGANRLIFLRGLDNMDFHRLNKTSNVMKCEIILNIEETVKLPASLRTSPPHSLPLMLGFN